MRRLSKLIAGILAAALAFAGPALAQVTPDGPSPYTSGISSGSYKSGAYYPTDALTLSGNAALPTADTVYCEPYTPLGGGQTVAGLAVYVTTGVASQAGRLAVYDTAADGTCNGGALIAETASPASMTSSAALASGTFSTPVFLRPFHTVWLALWVKGQGSPASVQVGNPSGKFNWPWTATLIAGGTGIRVFSVAATYPVSAAPSTMTATTAAQTTSAPMIYVLSN